VIGQAPRHHNLYLAFGHNHIGLMTGPITGKLIAQLVSGVATDIDLQPFSPHRYLRQA
jgi:D-amino-acid dehydrogenase